MEPQENDLENVGQENINDIENIEQNKIYDDLENINDGINDIFKVCEAKDDNECAEVTEETDENVDNVRNIVIESNEEGGIETFINDHPATSKAMDCMGNALNESLSVKVSDAFFDLNNRLFSSTSIAEKSDPKHLSTPLKDDNILEKVDVPEEEEQNRKYVLKNITSNENDVYNNENDDALNDLPKKIDENKVIRIDEKKVQFCDKITLEYEDNQNISPENVSPLLSSLNDASVKDKNESIPIDPEPTIVESSQCKEDIFQGMSRKKLTEECHIAQTLNAKRSQINSYLETKLAEFFRRKRAELGLDKGSSAAIMSRINDKAIETRYLKLRTLVCDLHSQRVRLIKENETQVTEVEKGKTLLREVMADKTKKFKDLRMQSMINQVVMSRTNVKMKLDEIEEYFQAELERDNELRKSRIMSIRAQNDLDKQIAILETSNELEIGSRIIDYEQMRTEKSALLEKIANRTCENQKLRDKIAVSCSMISHIREKIEFSKISNRQMRLELNAVDELGTNNRDQLNRMRKNQETIRRDNISMKRRCGMLNKKTLLVDFEKNVRKLRYLRQNFMKLHDDYENTVVEIQQCKQQFQTRKTTMINMADELQRQLDIKATLIRKFTGRYKSLIPTLPIISTDPVVQDERVKGRVPGVIRDSSSQQPLLTALN